MSGAWSTEARQGSVSSAVNGSSSVGCPDTPDIDRVATWLNRRSTETNAVVAGLTRDASRLKNIASVIECVDNALPGHIPATGKQN